MSTLQHLTPGISAFLYENRKILVGIIGLSPRFDSQDSMSENQSELLKQTRAFIQGFNKAKESNDNSALRDREEFTKFVEAKEANYLDTAYMQSLDTPEMASFLKANFAQLQLIVESPEYLETAKKQYADKLAEITKEIDKQNNPRKKELQLPIPEKEITKPGESIEKYPPEKWRDTLKSVIEKIDEIDKNSTLLKNYAAELESIRTIIKEPSSQNGNNAKSTVSAEISVNAENSNSTHKQLPINDADAFRDSLRKIGSLASPSPAKSLLKKVTDLDEKIKGDIDSTPLPITTLIFNALVIFISNFFNIKTNISQKAEKDNALFQVRDSLKGIKSKLQTYCNGVQDQDRLIIANKNKVKKLVNLEAERGTTQAALKDIDENIAKIQPATENTLASPAPPEQPAVTTPTTPNYRK